MSTDEEEVSEGFEDEDVICYSKRANQNAIRNVSHHAYQNNKKSNAAKSSGEDEEKLSYKRASIDSHYTSGKKSTIIWTSALRKKFVEAVKKLGIDNAAPRKIVELMKVDGLTRDHVASHLQKYRIMLKKLANKNDDAETSTKPSLLESSMVNDASWNNSSLMHKQEQMNWPSYSGMDTTNPSILNTSSSCFPFLEASNVNTTLPTELIYSCSSPNQGYSMEAMGNNLDDQRNFIYDTTSVGHVVNSMISSNSGFTPNLDGFFYNYDGSSTEVHPYNNIELGSSCGVNMNKELAMSWNQENPINIENFSNASFAENSNGFGSYYSLQSEFDEMGLYDLRSNDNFQNAIEKDKLVMTEADIDSLLSYGDVNGAYGDTSNNIPVTLDPLSQDLNVCNFQDIVSIDPINNVETPSINQLQTLDGYLPAFDPTYNMDLDEQFMEPIWNLGTLANDMTYQGLTLDSNVQDE